ncbi:DeoR/GlpR family DNA-binding transcription regulator [Gluconacetobacter entanii]|uniref:DeoR/GlpR family DNA-binding transcription regulator n=1 Tax=Gluconacetobacter entanii TaxID=108528 RepID=UPI001C932FC4|nr:DeoR/GlpR family DNA-binding transcription regulator [Gluconacetobacter entanii]MBY4638799.1 DeoR/GlpR family DNA-binding transcription regulator [Gluconacetobacter entanii]MCW4580745.1 DeoR/GlpR family DNA-binding transcription regulator [Gluconacetobacter entanii]MCW4584074.1 DeoR/GlpR family DNA-binding transcription regulator [Gluconacetobacter entanii]MCW4587462.1 DeoR/GlpR family DNA-binding transcription regulator [Gluconacetobacter entanii]
MSENTGPSHSLNSSRSARRGDNTTRQQRILGLLLETGNATIDALAAHFDVSRMTIHRDANALAQQGLVEKLHGGIALRNRAATQKTVSYRMALAREGKQAVIARAISLIRPEQIIILDDSTTVAEMLPLLPALAPLTIITNAMGVVQALAPYPDLRLICLGGDYNRPRNAFFGLICEQAAQGLRANTMFLSTSVVHGGAAFQNNQDIIKIKRVLMEICDKTVLLVDSSKFRKGGLYRLAGLDAFDHVLTDAQISPAIHEKLNAAGIPLEICKPDGES